MRLGYQVNLPTPDGHSSAQAYQRIVCFACPACYLLFNLRDECLQHMAAKNHFTETLPLTGKGKHPLEGGIRAFIMHAANIIFTSLSL